MKAMTRLKTYLTLVLILLWGSKAGAQISIKTDFTQSPVAMSPTLMGAFFEDINYGADGGLYAELIQNRSFEYYPVANYTDMQPLDAWSVAINGDSDINISVENTSPLNSNNTKYLKVEVNQPNLKAGVRNTGFDGITLDKGKRYDFSIYLKRDNNFNGAVAVQLVSPTNIVLHSDTIHKLSEEWQKYELTFYSGFSLTNAALQLSPTATGTIYADMVSLFPQETFNNRQNGLRKDLAQAIADLNPTFLRFPGGCISHGRGLDNAYRWKHTVGDVAERKPNWNLWGYHQTYGLGFYEYFLFCEDINAIPLPVVPVGVSCQFRGREVAPLSEMQMWVDDALDLIEFANGPADSEWGAVRAQMGHPEPFNMEYICLGNEEDDIPEFRERFMMITDSIRKYHPEIEIIGTSGTDDTGSHYHSLWEFSRENHLDAVDEHYYNDPEWFFENTHRYDNFDREGPTVFIGEYASRDDRLYNALAEAAYLTGVERNSDIIEFTCYAPLLSNVNHQQWHPDLIRFNNNQTVKTANYYVQQLYGVHNGDEYYPSVISYEEGLLNNFQQMKGQTGVGTWNTQAEFADLTISTTDGTLYQDNFDNTDNWTTQAGSFSVSNNSLIQSSAAEPALSLFNLPITEDNYTIKLKARKTGGSEGFLIPFALNGGDYYWFNIAGWNNTQHAVEKIQGSAKSLIQARSGSIQSNQWYEITIAVNSGSAQCFINDELIFEVSANTNLVYVSSIYDTASNDIILKLVNPTNNDLDTEIQLEGVSISPQARIISLQGQPDQRNSISNAQVIVPVESEVTLPGSTFTHLIPAHSFQVIRVQKTGTTGNFSPISEQDNNTSTIFITPNPTKGTFAVGFNGEDEPKTPFDLKLIDLNGKVHYSLTNQQSRTIHIPDYKLPKGVYLVQISTANELHQGKVSFY